jgi:asparaginyl-tRNA synthetase
MQIMDRPKRPVLFFERSPPVSEREIMIGEKLADFQARLKREGGSFEAHLRKSYTDRWRGEPLLAALAVRTQLVVALHEFLAQRGLVNIERVSLSPITDPLAHDVEHVPVIDYKGVPYRTTHSMIYCKMLACMNPAISGIFVDSPNIRLERPHPEGSQRNKYLVDFSQMDIELRREARIGRDSYFRDVQAVSAILEAERERALGFFEDLIVFAMTRVQGRCGSELAALGVRIDVPSKPFPRFDSDEAVAKYGKANLERAIGAATGHRFFWILGLLRENYDLVYPYYRADGSVRDRSDIKSKEVFNYDLAMGSTLADGKPGDAYEVLSGGLREWIYEAISGRLVANGVLPALPRFSAEGELENMAELEGYGPFLTAARLSDAAGEPLFPETAGGGLGIERSLFALLNGPAIRRIEELTFFGKNPDSAPVYLF